MRGSVIICFEYLFEIRSIDEI